MKRKQRFIVASIIPTGIQCAIGGFIGDATQVTNKLAKHCDFLITNPNAVNGGAFNFKDQNVLYVEGYAVDQFFRKEIELLLPRKNRIGVIIEKISDNVARKYAVKSIEGLSCVAGIDVIKVEFIQPLKKKITLENGQFCGSVEDVSRLIAVSEKLVHEDSVDAVALSTHIDVPLKYIRMHHKGSLPNPYGILEALLSHTITQALGVPTAHAPLLTKKEIEFFLFQSFGTDPRSALENISAAYLGSVLVGLSEAPRLVPYGEGDITLEEIGALVVPMNCLRGVPVAWALKHNIPVIEVRENTNIFKPLERSGRTGVRPVATYDEAEREIKRIKAVRSAR